jgi:hypothetical protein
MKILLRALLSILALPWQEGNCALCLGGMPTGREWQNFYKKVNEECNKKGLEQIILNTNMCATDADGKRYYGRNKKIHAVLPGLDVSKLLSRLLSLVNSEKDKYLVKGTVGWNRVELSAKLRTLLIFVEEQNVSVWIDEKKSDYKSHEVRDWDVVCYINFAKDGLTIDTLNETYRTSGSIFLDPPPNWRPTRPS